MSSSGWQKHESGVRETALLLCSLLRRVNGLQFLSPPPAPPAPPFCTNRTPAPKNLPAPAQWSGSPERQKRDHCEHRPVQQQLGVRFDIGHRKTCPSPSYLMRLRRPHFAQFNKMPRSSSSLILIRIAHPAAETHATSHKDITLEFREK